MHIITCYKLVPEEQDIIVKADHTLSFDRASWKVGTYDRNAIEAGMTLAESMPGAEVSALTAGGRQLDNTKMKKDLLSRGPGKLFLVVDDALDDADAYQTAAVLAAAVNKIGVFDLVICGEGSSDLYAQQVGPQLGQQLGVACLNAVSKIVPQGDKVIVERSLEDAVEVWELPLPAVLSVTTDVNLPRIPGMKDVLAAGKKPVTQWTLADLEEPAGGWQRPTRIVSTLAPEQTTRKNIVFEGPEAVETLYGHIRKDIQ